MLVARLQTPTWISPTVAPALTFVLIFILMVSFLEKWIEADCGENRRPLSQVGESHWILLANIFSAHGVPIGAESACRSSRRNTFPVFALATRGSNIPACCADFARTKPGSPTRLFLIGMLSGLFPPDSNTHAGSQAWLFACAKIFSPRYRFSRPLSHIRVSGDRQPRSREYDRAGHATNTEAGRLRG